MTFLVTFYFFHVNCRIDVRWHRRRRRREESSIYLEWSKKNEDEEEDIQRDAIDDLLRKIMS